MFARIAHPCEGRRSGEAEHAIPTIDFPCWGARGRGPKAGERLIDQATAPVRKGGRDGAGRATIHRQERAQ